jgi:hypothetical protein
MQKMTRRLRNGNGVIVNVSDETAALLDAEWVDAETEKPKRATRAKKSDD